ncbi:hypothetical protein [Carnobacterium sp. AT7]|nr:hypothetical protein [Carnobacterium sp. AT7]
MIFNKLQNVAYTLQLTMKSYVMNMVDGENLQLNKETNSMIILII